VLSHEEIQAALDNQPVSDISLAPVFEEVRRHKVAIDLLRKQGQKRKASLNLDLVKKLHGMFYEEDDTKQAGKYRRDMPIHRLYFHEIAPPDKISVKMRQLFEWVETQEARRMHPVKLGATLHYQMMRIYPFSQHSGKVSRLLMNCVLLQNDYLPVIVHAVERQRYYESLRLPAPTSISLLIESLENALTSAAKLFGAAAPARAAV
jgi:Fic family protein